MKNGIFHAKIAFLSNEEHSVLLVGSGNLTFGGGGKNVEFIDMVDSKDTSEPFRDFSGFLSALLDRRRGGEVWMPETGWLMECQRRLSGIAEKSYPRSPRLLHSLNEPVGNQLVDQVASERVRTVTILSPYHDVDATAVDRLAEGVIGDRLRIIAGSTKRVGSPFPFNATKVSRVEACQLTLDDSRPIHAKWIEIQTADNTISLTGSVNATTPALWTTRNAEAGILRIRSNSDGGFFKIEAGIVPSQPVIEFTHASSIPLLPVYAQLDPDNRIRGQMLGHDVVGEWSMRLLKPGSGPERSMASEASVTVRDDGTFVIDVGQLTNVGLEFVAGIQVELTQGQRVARGWLQSEMALNSAAISRMAGVIVGMLDRSGASLEFRNFTVELLKAVKSGLPSGTSQDDAKVGDGSKVGLGGRSGGKGTGGWKGKEDLISVLFSRLGRDLSSKSLGGGSRPHVQAGGSEDDDNDRRDEENQSKTELTLSELHERFHNAAMASLRGDKLRATLLVLWFDCSLAVYIRSGDLGAALEFVAKWRRVASARPTKNKTGEIAAGMKSFMKAVTTEEHLSRYRSLVVFSCLLMARNVPLEDFEGMRAIHDQLENMLDGTVSPNDYGALPDPSSDLVTFLFGSEIDVEALLKRIASVETRRSLASRLADSVSEGNVPQELLKSFDPAVFLLLNAIVPGEAVKLGRVSRSTQSCPACHLAISPVVQTLHRQFICKCPNTRCGALLIMGNLK